MQLQKYDSEGKILIGMCPCGKQATIPFSEMQVTGGMPDRGLLVALPKCPCGAQSSIITGSGIVTPAGHALNCLAARLAEGGHLGEGVDEKEIDSVVAEVAKNYDTEEGEALKNQFLGVEPLEWVSTQ